jgi:hypothetical protein
MKWTLLSVYPLSWWSESINTADEADAVTETLLWDFHLNCNEILAIFVNFQEEAVQTYDVVWVKTKLA